MLEENKDQGESSKEKENYSMHSQLSFGDPLDGEIQQHFRTDQVKFNGFLFELNADRTKPALLSLDNQYAMFPEQRNFLSFLKTLKRHGMLNHENDGQVIYVED